MILAIRQDIQRAAEEVPFEHQIQFIGVLGDRDVQGSLDSHVLFEFLSTNFT